MQLIVHHLETLKSKWEESKGLTSKDLIQGNPLTNMMQEVSLSGHSTPFLPL